MDSLPAMLAALLLCSFFPYISTGYGGYGSGGGGGGVPYVQPVPQPVNFNTGGYGVNGGSYGSVNGGSYGGVTGYGGVSPTAPVLRIADDNAYPPFCRCFGGQPVCGSDGASYASICDLVNSMTGSPNLGFRCGTACPCSFNYTEYQALQKRTFRGSFVNCLSNGTTVDSPLALQTALIFDQKVGIRNDADCAVGQNGPWKCPSYALDFPPHLAQSATVPRPPMPLPVAEGKPSARPAATGRAAPGRATPKPKEPASRGEGSAKPAEGGETAAKPAEGGEGAAKPAEAGAGEGGAPAGEAAPVAEGGTGAEGAEGAPAKEGAGEGVPSAGEQAAPAGESGPAAGGEAPAEGAPASEGGAVAEGAPAQREGVPAPEGHAPAKEGGAAERRRPPAAAEERKAPRAAEGGAEKSAAAAEGAPAEGEAAPAEGGASEAAPAAGEAEAPTAEGEAKAPAAEGEAKADKKAVIVRRTTRRPRITSRIHSATAKMGSVNGEPERSKTTRRAHGVLIPPKIVARKPTAASVQMQEHAVE